MPTRYQGNYGQFPTGAGGKRKDATDEQYKMHMQELDWSLVKHALIKP